MRPPPTSLQPSSPPQSTSMFSPEQLQQPLCPLLSAPQVTARAITSQGKCYRTTPRIPDFSELPKGLREASWAPSVPPPQPSLATFAPLTVRLGRPTQLSRSLSQPLHRPTLPFLLTKSQLKHHLFREALPSMSRHGTLFFPHPSSDHALNLPVSRSFHPTWLSPRERQNHTSLPRSVSAAPTTVLSRAGR